MTRALRLAAAALLATGCGGLDTVDLTRSATATVPGYPVPAPLPEGAVRLGVAIGRDALARDGISPDEVDSARVTALRLEVVAGTSLEGWLDEISFHVEAPGLPRVEVARRGGVRALAPGTRALDLEPTGVDLKPYLDAPSAEIFATGEGTLPPERTTIRADATIRVDVDVTGLLR